MNSIMSRDKYGLNNSGLNNFERDYKFKMQSSIPQHEIKPNVPWGAIVSTVEAEKYDPTIKWERAIENIRDRMDLAADVIVENIPRGISIAKEDISIAEDVTEGVEKGVKRYIKEAGLSDEAAGSLMDKTAILGRYSKSLGKAGLAIGGISSIEKISTSKNKLQTSFEEVGGTALGIIGSKMGSAIIGNACEIAGGAIGTAIGGVEVGGPIGSGVGLTIGSIAGGIAGSEWGTKWGKNLGDIAYNNYIEVCERECVPNLKKTNCHDEKK